MINRPSQLMASEFDSPMPVRRCVVWSTFWGRGNGTPGSVAPLKGVWGDAATGIQAPTRTRNPVTCAFMGVSVEAAETAAHLHACGTDAPLASRSRRLVVVSGADFGAPDDSRHARLGLLRARWAVAGLAL